MRMFGRRTHKESPAPEFVSYQMAYRFLPDAVYRSSEVFLATLRVSPLPELITTFLKIARALECDLRQLKDVASRFNFHTRHYPDGSIAYIVEYPQPGHRATQDGIAVLPPLFSVIVDRIGATQSYYVLGLSKVGVDSLDLSKTTFRAIAPDGTNFNLGPGPVPNVTALWQFLLERT